MVFFLHAFATQLQSIPYATAADAADGNLFIIEPSLFNSITFLAQAECSEIFLFVSSV